jgi:hypothetical protein
MNTSPASFWVKKASAGVKKKVPRVEKKVPRVEKKFFSTRCDEMTKSFLYFLLHFVTLVMKRKLSCSVILDLQFSFKPNRFLCREKHLAQLLGLIAINHTKQ